MSLIFFRFGEWNSAEEIDSPKLNSEKIGSRFIGENITGHDLEIFHFFF